MPVSSVDIAMLSSPLSPQSTSHVGSTFSQSDYTQKQSIAGTNGGGNRNGGIPTHQLLASDASSIQISADIDAVNQSKELESPGIPGRDYDQNAIGGEAQTSVGGNVGGVVADAEKAGPAFVPEELDPFSIKEQRDEIQDLATEGYEHKEGKTAYGKKAMRKYKQDQKQEWKDLKNEGIISKDEYQQRKENLKLAKRRERRKWGD